MAADVCKALGIDDTSKACSRLDDDEKGVQIVHTLGGVQEMSVVNESGLYSLIMGSRKPSAKRFKKWVTADVCRALELGNATKALGRLDADEKGVGLIDILFCG